MTDLLRSLIEPGPQGLERKESQDSFHSAADHLTQEHAPTLTKVVTNENDGLKNKGTLASHNQSKASTTCDVETFLASLADDVPLSSTSASDGQTKPLAQSKFHADGTLQPVELNQLSSNHVSALYTQCQQKGISLTFEIDNGRERQLFSGLLRIGSETINLDQLCRSKKEAKERLAEKGLGLLNKAGIKRDLSAGMDAHGNWIGKLQGKFLHRNLSYRPRIGQPIVSLRDLTAPTRCRNDSAKRGLAGIEYNNQEFGAAQSPVYTVYALGRVFACTCVIASHPAHTFGTKTEGFPSKKQARNNAAAKAVQFLISEGKLNADGSTLARKRVKMCDWVSSVQLHPEGKGLNISKESSFAQKVNDICPLLGFSAPQYHLTPVSLNAPNILSGYASFFNNPHLPGPIGHVSNIFGKKAAKEEVAKGVWEVLIKVAEGRGVKLGEA